MSTWSVQLAIVALFALTCGLLALAWMRGRLGVAALVLFAVSVVVWIAAFVAITNDFQGANDFPSSLAACPPIPYGSAVAFIVPPLMIALAALAMLVSRGQQWRARRALAHDNHG